jgi:hypothetical protein
VATEKPYSGPAREQHPVEVSKTWPNQLTPSPTQLPGQTSKTTPTK